MVSGCCKATQDLMAKHNLRVDDVDLFVFHQANEYMLKHLRKKLKISEEKQIKVIRAIDKLDKPGFGLKGVEDLLKNFRVSLNPLKLRFLVISFECDQQ